MGNCISSKARTTDVEQKHSSSLLMATLQIVKDRPHEKSNRKLLGGTVDTLTITTPHFICLLASWLAEERHVPLGRLYKYLLVASYCSFDEADLLLFAQWPSIVMTNASVRHPSFSPYLIYNFP
ncbi:hypothetical protein Gotur_027202 [Gossypium turneri]